MSSIGQLLYRLARRRLPRSLGPRRVKSGPLRGHILYTSWRDYPAGIIGTTERPLLEWFQQHARPGQTWLDVGGHFGYTALALSTLVGPTGRVFTFEPVVATAGCLARAKELNRSSQITVIPMGLGCPITLHSITVPIERGMADNTGAERGWHETVQIARFDWLWPLISRGDTRIDGVKIDVQGMELETLQGMLEALRSQRPLVVLEVHNGVSRDAVLSLLADAGYSTSPIAIDLASGATNTGMLDDHSYAFSPRS